MRKSSLCFVIMLGWGLWLGRQTAQAQEEKPSFQPLPPPPQPVSIQAGEQHHYALPLEDGRRYTVSLLPLTGDADLYAGFDSNLSPSRHTFRANAGPLQTDQFFLDAREWKANTLYVLVQGVTNCEYLLTATSTDKRLHLTPAQRKALKVTAQDITGDPNTLVTYLSIENLTGTWYEVTVAKQGKCLEKCAAPRNFMLGPKQARSFGWVAFDGDSKLVFELRRSTQKAQTYLVCDLLVRALSGGRPLDPAVSDAVDKFIPRLFLFVGAALRFQRGDVKGGTQEVLRVIRQHPEVLNSLHQVLQSSGINIARAVLSTKLAAALGALSAGQAMWTAAQAPTEEKVELVLRGAS